jgi:hypothetical protein
MHVSVLRMRRRLSHLNMPLKSRFVRHLGARIQSVGDRHARVSRGHDVGVGERLDVLQDDAGHAQVPHSAADDDLASG